MARKTEQFRGGRGGGGRETTFEWAGMLVGNVELTPKGEVGQQSWRGPDFFEP